MESRKITVKEEDGKIILIIPKGDGANKYNRRKEFESKQKAISYMKQQRLEGAMSDMQE